MSEPEISYDIDVDLEDRAELTQEIVWPNGNYIHRLVAAGTFEACEAAKRLMEM
jgi:hypothetical protein